MPAGSIIQFERKGFYIVDKAFDPSQPDQPAELILIPDGKASSIALKYQVPGGGEKEKAAVGGGGKKAGGKTPAKDKDAAAQAKKGAATKRVGLPEVAPKEPVESVMKSEGTKGYDIPVRVRFSLLFPCALVLVGNLPCTDGVPLPWQTKMYRMDPPYGTEAVETPVATKMHDVKPFDE